MNNKIYKNSTRVLLLLCIANINISHTLGFGILITKKTVKRDLKNRSQNLMMSLFSFIV